MPTYEYGCRGCGHSWELEQRISEKPVKKCPVCGKAKAQRLISGGNFILKGSGWYADLYHKPASKPAEGTKATESKSTDNAKPATSEATTGEKKKSEAPTEHKKAANE